jgi:hypothetical protein
MHNNTTPQPEAPIKPLNPGSFLRPLINILKYIRI